MPNSLKLSETFPVSAQLLYDAWIDADSHSEFTGSDAECDPKVGGKYSAWDGYIFGKNLKLEPYKRIVQSWRTTEFAETDKDSQIEILFEPVSDEECRFTLIHTNIPKGETEKYKQGWIDYYLEPMKEYFIEL